MMLNTYRSFCLLLFLLNAFGPGNQNQIIKDDLGTAHVLGTPPQRIISLAPNITEILYALGLEEKIVGVTRYCNYPKEALILERVGGMVDPDLEKIIALRPDLIISFRGNPLSLVRRFKDLDLPVFVLESGIKVESVFTLIERIGLITRREKEAESLVNKLRKDLGKVQTALKNAEHRPKVFLDLYGKELWTCGKDSFLNDLVLTAEGINIAGKIPRSWLPYNREELIYQDPEHIVIIAKSQEDFIASKKWLGSEVSLEGIQAIRQGNIHYLQEDLVTRMGPRILQALDQLARILHPSLFKDKPCP
jgi:iron complex transport system substrate-binding protein